MFGGHQGPSAGNTEGKARGGQSGCIECVSVHAERGLAPLGGARKDEPRRSECAGVWSMARLRVARHGRGRQPGPRVCEAYVLRARVRGAIEVPPNKRMKQTRRRW